MISVELTDSMGAKRPLKRTVLFAAALLSKLLPLMVTLVPVDTAQEGTGGQPEVGVKLVIVGGGRVVMNRTVRSRLA